MLRETVVNFVLYGIVLLVPNQTVGKTIPNFAVSFHSNFKFCTYFSVGYKVITPSR